MRHRHVWSCCRYQTSQTTIDSLYIREHPITYLFGAWTWHFRPSTQWCENRSVARHASKRTVYPLFLPTWGRTHYHNDPCHKILPWSCGEFPYRLLWNRQRRATIGLPMFHRKRTVWTSHSLRPTSPQSSFPSTSLVLTQDHRLLFQHATAVLVPPLDESLLLAVS